MNCNCFNSFHPEGSRQHKRLYCEMLQHFSRQVQICRLFPNTEQYKIHPSQNRCFNTWISTKFHLSALVYEPKRSASMTCFFFDTQTRSLSQNSRGRPVGHCATHTTEVEKCGIQQTETAVQKRTEDNMQLKTHEENKEYCLEHTEIPSPSFPWTPCFSGTESSQSSEVLEKCLRDCP